MVDIAHRTIRPEPPSRPERVFELNTMGTVGDAARPLSVPERILQITAVRRLLVLAALCTFSVLAPYVVGQSGTESPDSVLVTSPPTKIKNTVHRNVTLSLKGGGSFDANT